MNKALLPALMIACCLLAACDSNEDESVAKGAFVAHVTGAASAELQGDGSFFTDIFADTTFLELRLKAGEFTMPGRPDTLAMPYGVFISVPWTGRTGTYTISSNPRLWSNYVMTGAFSPMW